MNSRELGSPIKFKVERIAPNDWRKYKETRLKSLETNAVAFEGSLDIEAEYEENYWRHLLNVEHIFGVEVDGKYVSVASLNTSEQGWPSLDRVYTLEEYRGLNLAKKVIAEVEYQAVKIGITTLNLGVTKTEINVIQFYESLGYTKTGREFPHDSSNASSQMCVEMSKKLISRE